VQTTIYAADRNVAVLTMLVATSVVAASAWSSSNHVLGGNSST
jgi:hypothetical protein